MVQVTPFRVKAVGAGLLPLQVPLKPIPVDAPGASELFQDRLVAVTCWPVCVQVALQPWPMCCAGSGKVNASVQPLIVVEPVFVIVILVVSPPGHWFWMT